MGKKLWITVSCQSVRAQSSEDNWISQISELWQHTFCYWAQWQTACFKVSLSFCSEIVNICVEISNSEVMIIFLFLQKMCLQEMNWAGCLLWTIKKGKNITPQNFISFGSNFVVASLQILYTWSSFRSYLPITENGIRRQFIEGN